MAADPKTMSTDQNIRRVVNMLLAREGRKHHHLAEILGATRQTATNKLRGETRFRVDELELLARIFHVDIAVFVDPTRPIPTTPVLDPVPDPGLDLLTCTYRQVRWSEAVSVPTTPDLSPLRGIARYAA